MCHSLNKQAPYHITNIYLTLFSCIFTRTENQSGQQGGQSPVAEPPTPCVLHPIYQVSALPGTPSILGSLLRLQAHPTSPLLSHPAPTSPMNILALV